MTTPESVIKFWFEEISRECHFKKDSDFDQLVETRFGLTLLQARVGELWHWRETARGALAEIIVLDQFSRNIYRDTADAFSADSLALVLAEEAVRRGLDQQLPVTMRSFLYMPYMHSESAIVHEEALRLFDQPGLENSLKFEQRHKAIIDLFGRYPHRNRLLNRESTAQEIEFLKQPGSSF